MIFVFRILNEDIAELVRSSFRHELLVSHATRPSSLFTWAPLKNIDQIGLLKNLSDSG